MSDTTTTLTDAEQAEIDSAAKTAERVGDPAADIRRWLLETHTATLCTVSARPKLIGHPFGSIVPFAVDAEGRPIILIADIAAHTANLRQEPRASLFVSDAQAVGDPQTSWRISIMGRFQRVLPADTQSRHAAEAKHVDAGEYADLHARYLERVPAADGYVKQHSFDYWRMETIDTVRYIAGFGRICWVDGDEVLRDPMAGGLNEAAGPAIEHMNEDHAANMVEMCAGLYGFTPASAKMTALDATGFRIVTESPQRHLFFGFGREIDAGSLRMAVVEVLRRARSERAQVSA